MTAKELAGKFDLSVSEMCNLTGFSRSGLNEIASGRSIKKGIKKTEARYILRELAAEMLREEIAEADKRHVKRVEIANNLFGLF